MTFRDSTPANEQDRAQVGELAKQIQEVTGDSVEIAFVDQSYTGDKAAAAAEEHGIRLKVVKLPTAKRCFVLLPRRWVVERSFGWMTRFRRLVRDYERLAETLTGLHFRVCHDAGSSVRHFHAAKCITGSSERGKPMRAN